MNLVHYSHNVVCEVIFENYLLMNKGINEELLSLSHFRK